jgi:hypothetical protein
MTLTVHCLSGAEMTMRSRPRSPNARTGSVEVRPVMDIDW